MTQRDGDLTTLGREDSQTDASTGVVQSGETLISDFVETLRACDSVDPTELAFVFEMLGDACGIDLEDLV